MKVFIGILLALMTATTAEAGEWKLVWSDEFDKAGLPDAAKWDYETGFIRNDEQQYYTRARTGKRRAWKTAC